MVRKQKAVTFGTRFLERHDFIRLSIHSKCPFQYTALKNSSFGPSRSALPIALVVETFFIPNFKIGEPIVAWRRVAAYLKEVRNEQREK